MGALVMCMTGACNAGQSTRGKIDMQCRVVKDAVKVYQLRHQQVQSLGGQLLCSSEHFNSAYYRRTWADRDTWRINQSLGAQEKPFYILAKQTCSVHPPGCVR